jgi:hypothetical protein
MGAGIKQHLFSMGAGILLIIYNGDVKVSP